MNRFFNLVPVLFAVFALVSAALTFAYELGEYFAGADSEKPASPPACVRCGSRDYLHKGAHLCSECVGDEEYDPTSDWANEAANSHLL